MANYKKRAAELLALADVEINGSRPWDITVHDERLYKRVFAEGSLGLGEAYMDGWWDSQKLDECFAHILRARLDERIAPFSLIIPWLSAKFFNLQSKARAFQVGQKHYDIGNDVFLAMLDKRMVYTCGYWKEAQSLEEAQVAKLDLVCSKIGLKAGDRVLDIGCGWGSFLKYAAEKYGIQGVGITVSEEQKALAEELCRELPIEIRLQDYRDLNEQFDHIVSLGMFEHVGYKNYRECMSVAARCLKEEGLFLLHTIGSNYSAVKLDRWIDRYIFPNGMLPSIKQIGGALENLFVMEDWHNFGPYYDKTLVAWHRNFLQSWPKLCKKYPERFRRMWEYYLLSCAGLFRARQAQLWQIVLSKKGVQGGYASIR